MNENYDRINGNKNGISTDKLFFRGVSVPCLLLLYPIPVSVKVLSLYFYLQLRRTGHDSSVSWSQAFSFFTHLSELKCTCILKVLHKVDDL